MTQGLEPLVSSPHAGRTLAQVCVSENHCVSQAQKLYNDVEGVECLCHEAFLERK